MPAFQLTAAELEGLTQFVRALSAPAIEANPKGDRAAGERYFFGTGKCAGCHMVGGRGKLAGPDLSSVARELTLTEIEAAVKRPSETIKAGYTAVTVTLHDGRELNGLERNRNQFSLQLQDFAGRFHLLEQGEIASVAREASSAMPATACTAGECRDLMAYLSSLGGPAAGARGPVLEGEGGVAFASITTPARGDWPSYHFDLTGNRHSPVDQINAQNVAALKLQWVFPVNHYVMQTTPLVVDGVMYVSGPNQVWAIDGRAGRTIWHYQRARSTETRGDPARGTNRGVAILGDRVFVVTDNARLLALHRVTGQLLWETDVKRGVEGGNYGNTAAPIVVKDLVITGISGGDLGIRGFLSAYKITTGELAWRFWTTPKPGEPLSETWQGTALAQYGGGGGTWMTGTYDPETNLVFWGVGNPFPAYDGSQRRGDNLYTGAVVALDADTGARKWHYQFTPHDLYDWDAGQTPMLLNRRYRGRDRKLLLQANRNGFFYVMDRTNGELLLTEKFADRVTWASAIGKDGRPVLTPGMEPSREGTKVCPNVLGATNWHSVAFNPATGLFYLMAREACGIYSTGPWNGRRPAPVEAGQMFLRALDIETGKRVWEVPNIGPADSWGGVLSTAGGVVFFGEDSGAFAAADAKTGKILWQIQTNASTELGDGHSWRASPMTYMAGGKQYVAVANGPNILVFGL